MEGNDSNVINIKCENSPSRDEDNENTPVREESGVSKPNSVGITVTGGAGWETDVEDEQHAAPLLEMEMCLKQSPNLNDHEQTPLRVTYTDSAGNQQYASVSAALLPKEIETLQKRDQIPLRISNMLSSKEAAMLLKRSPILNDNEQTPLRIPDTDIVQPTKSGQHSVGVAESYLNDLMENSIAPVLPASKIEKQRKLHLGFLDVFSDIDFDTNSLNQAAQMEPTMEHDADNHDGSEEGRLQALIEQRQKQLQKLERTLEIKKRKKNKKNKKLVGHKRRRCIESHKRSRSRTPSLSGSRSCSPIPQKTRKQNAVESNRRINPKAILKEDPEKLEYVPVRAEEKCLKFVRIHKLKQPEIGTTIEMKRQLALERAKRVLQAMHLKACKTPDTEFLVVDTIKKLHSCSAYMKCDIFDNPSPLCNNNNVKYKFNSTSSSNINLKKWGLERLPSTTTALLRLTGIDVSRLMELQRNSRMSVRNTNKVKNAKANTEEEGTGLYKSISTQTDKRIINYSRDVAVQVMPTSPQGVYWLHPRFDERNLSQQEINAMMALKELCASSPSSSSWADKLFRELRHALAIKRAEVKEFGQ